MKRYALLLGMAAGVSAVALTGEVTLALVLADTGVSISDVCITPVEPTASDEVSVTVSGWTPATNYRVYDTDLRIVGSQIWLDLYWHAPGIGGQALTPYDYTHPLGILSPGVYTVHVTNRDAMSGSTTTTFTVSPSSPGPDQGPDDGGEPAPGQGSPEWFEQKRQQARQRLPDSASVPSLPGLEIHGISRSQVTSAKEGISQLRITPADPTPSDYVSVTVCGWKSSSRLEVDYANVNMEGRKIWLDLYWHMRPTVVPHGNNADALTQMFDAEVSGYPLDPFGGSPYEVTESLGMFSSGTYTLYVTNQGPVSGNASTVFVVADPDDDETPWWWTAFRSR